jgi:uncharacterized protein (TIGR03067 family)
MSLLRLTLSVLAAATLAGGAAGAEDVANDRDRLQGEWQIVAITDAGEPVPREKLKGLKFVFEGDTLTMASAEKGAELEKFGFTLDPSSKPKGIDLTEKGTAIPAIYELEGDTLRLCLPARTATERPAAFESKKGSKVSLIVLQRVKKQP